MNIRTVKIIDWEDLGVSFEVIEPNVTWGDADMTLISVESVMSALADLSGECDECRAAFQLLTSVERDVYIALPG